LNTSAKIGFLFIFFVNYSLTILGQGEISDRKHFNNNELSYAIHLNSNGVEFNTHYGKRLDGTRRRLWSASFSWIRHPKEYKISNPYFDSKRKFVFGKVNSLYTLKLGYGKHKIIYNKTDKGVAVSYSYQIGPVFGFLKPVYYEILYPTSTPYQYLVITEKFDYTIHGPSDIYSRASFFTGLNETTITPGGFIRFGFDFEFSDEEKKLTALECGGQVEVFPQTMTIMANAENSFFFVSVFVGYRFGRITKTMLNAQY
jgi:hypothetical protein